MKKLLFLILLLFTVNITFSQITTNVSLKCQIYASSGTAPTFNVQSLVSDELSKYDGSSVAAGDKLFIIDGSECYELHISSITLGSGSVLNFVAYDSTGVLTTIPNGQAAVIRKYSIQQVPFIPAGLRSDLASCILQKIASTVNDITGSGGSGTVTSITAGTGLTGGTITTSGTIAADTSGMLVSKDYLENQYVKGAQVNTVFSAQSLATSISQRDGGEAFFSLTGDTLFHIGGWTSGVSNNEIWFSRNEGYTWAQASDAAFAARHTFGFVKHENAFYVIGSDLADYGGRDEVWKSWDGLTWTQVTDAAGFGKRVLSAAVTKGDTLFVMGGQDTTGILVSAFQDVWRSVDDGVTWVQHCASCFPEIGNVAGGATVWDGQIWILAGELNSVAGTRVNTVYSSYDGLTWAQRSDMPVTGRSYVRAFVMDDILYCYAGYTDAPGNSRTLIATTDGENWTDVTTTDLPATHAASLAVKNRSTFYVLSGDAFTGQYLVRRLIETVSSVHRDTVGGVFHVSPQGNVGIGTTSPPQKLSVYGSIFSSMREKNVLDIATQDPTLSSIFTLSENIKTSNSTPFYIERFNSSHATKANNVEFGTTNTGTISFIHNNNARLKINSTGNVNVSTNLGINTETFSYSSRLAVDGVSHLMGGMVIGSDNIAVSTSGANIKFTADGLTTNTTAGSDNKILKLGADGGSALASRGAILWLHGQNATGAGNAALQLGSSGTFFVYSGASATQRLAITATGGANFGSGTFTAAAGVVNAQTGFRVNNAATAGQYLRGNGTNFVSGAITGDDLSGAIGTGLTVSGGLVIADTSFLATQSDIATIAGATNLAFSGSSSPVTLTSDTGTDVIFAAGSGLALSQSGGTATYSRTYSLIHTTITGGSTFFGTTAERPDNDTPGSATTSAVGSDFSVSGSTIDYTGGSGALIRVQGSISFSVADDGDYYVSMYKEGTEIGATSMRVSCVAGNYYSISLPATTTSGTTNDTFDVRIATVTGNSTTTMHRYGFIIERIY